MEVDSPPWSYLNVTGAMLTGTVVYIVFRCFRWTWETVKAFRFYNALPGESDFSLLTGNLHLFPTDEEERLLYELGLSKRFPMMYRVWFGPLVASVQLCHPETIKLLLKTAAPKPHCLGSVFDFFLPWLGEGLLIAKGRRWERSRRLLTPAFHFNILQPYVNVYNISLDVLLSKIEVYANSGESFDLFKLIKPYTLEVLLRCAMTYEEDVQNAKGFHPYLQTVEDLTALIIARLRNPLHHIQWIYNLSENGKKFKKLTDYVHSVSETIIKARQAALEKNNPRETKYLDFLDILLKARDEDGIGMTLTEIRNEVDTILFEGHDTTASALSWILYALGSNPSHMTAVQEEVDSVLDSRKNPYLIWDDLPKLEYLALCIKEGLRLGTPVPFIARQIENDLRVGGVTLPAGALVAVAIFNVHHHPDVWTDPEKFCPERFKGDNLMKIDPFAFVPFSAGPRNCIGQNFAMNELKVVIGSILKRFNLVPDLSHPVRRQAAAVMRAEGGLWMYAEHRSRAADIDISGTFSEDVKH